MARGRFTFWLDYAKDEQLLLAETIDELKQKRSFVTTIRDGIRLICDLRQGRVEVLFQLFPWVKAEFLVGVQPQETVGERALREQLERIERQLLQQGNTLLPLQSTTLGVTDGQPKAIPIPRFASPLDDDEDDTIPLVAVKQKTEDVGQAFLNAVLHLNR